MARNRLIVGKKVILDELQPKYFEDIIKWRNDLELNRYLNQPYKLTMEMQIKWYEEKYLNDMTQGLFIMIDKINNVPFGTIGWTDMDEFLRKCIYGRLLMSNIIYSFNMLEAHHLLSNFLYEKVDDIYLHVVKDNKKAIKWNKMLGFHTSKKIMFPKELFVNGMEQIEMVRSKDEYIALN